MAKIETRTHLGPHEVEIDTPLYGIMLIPNNGMSPVMSLKVFSNKEKAIRHTETFKATQAVVVTIRGTNA